MIVAVSLVMKKNDAIHARLAIVNDCKSTNDAVGISVTRALKEENDHCLASVCATEIVPELIKNEDKQTEIHSNKTCDYCVERTFCGNKPSLKCFEGISVLIK